MQTIVAILMVGMIGVVVLLGDDGFINNLGIGTSTSDTLTKGFWPVAFATTLIIMAIMRIRGKKKIQ